MSKRTNLSYRINLAREEAGGIAAMLAASDDLRALAIEKLGNAKAILISERRWLVTVLVVVGLVIAGKQAFAADVTPVGSLDNGATAGVSSAQLLAPGAFDLGLRYQLATDSLPAKSLGTEIQSSSESAVQEDENLIERISKTQLGFGIGLVRYLDVHAGVVSSYESLTDRGTNSIHGDRQENREELADKNGFASAHLMAKLRIFDFEVVKASIAPFVEFGAGKEAVHAVSRSEGNKFGWMGLLTYSARDIFALHLNGGFRYRDREELGVLSLRNELFYRAAAEAMFSKYVSVFVAGDGRQLKIADAGKQTEGEKREYDNWESANVQAGFISRYKGFRFDVYGGGRTDDESFGDGRYIVGAAISYLVKSSKRRDHRNDNAAVIVHDDPRQAAKQEEKDLKKMEPKVGKESAAGYQNVVLDKDGDVVDIVGDAGAQVEKGNQAGSLDDDFQAIDKRLKEEKARDKAGELSDPDRVERELEELNTAEENARKERERLQKIEEAKQRKELLKQTKENEAKIEKWRQEIREEGAVEKGVSAEDAEWNGF